MIPRTRTTVDYPLQTEAAMNRLIGRDYRSLLRSTGHLFRDGRWLDMDDPFHVYRELENPGLGALRTFNGSQYFEGYDPQYSQLGPERAFNWRPALGRYYSYAFWDDVYQTPLAEPTIPSYSDHVLDLNAKGTEFIRRLRPGNPIGTLGQFLVELRDLPRLPLLLRSRAKHFRDLGSEYLNVEFGWIPFVRDVINVGHTQLRMAAILDKLVKNNGIPIKRRSKREPVTTGSDWSFSDPIPYPFGWMGDPIYGCPPELSDFYTWGPYNSGADANITGETLLSWRDTTTAVTWYVGTFKYYVPDIGSSRWTDRAKLILSGSVPSPSILYQVYPWTWLADWFGNVGDILSNLSTNAVDSEVLLDSYVMEMITRQHQVEAHITWDYYEQEIGGIPFAAIAPGAEKVSYSFIEVQKLRQQASPFGFGLKTADFTFKQNSILAALLFSKKRPTLRTFGL